MKAVEENVVADVVEEKEPKKNRPGTFTGKDDPRIHDQRKARRGEKAERAPKTPYSEPKDAGAPGELILGWHVLNNDAEHDRTAAQRNMRIAFQAGPLAFSKHVQAMEQEWVARSGAAAAKEKPLEADEGTKRALALCEERLREIARKARES